LRNITAVAPQQSCRVFLKDWAERLDAFLTFNERDVLTGAGRISKGNPPIFSAIQK